ncbi:Osi10 [Drosophila busckii]|uniref:Osi10 n=1 Tax=Drosophila busckii TaxID=30019 RepID=A0A0M4EMU3_DROBS|nr:Osi10 [Drosophila busckii]
MWSTAAAAGALLLLNLLQLGASVVGSDLQHVSLEELQQFKQCVRGAQRPKLGECLGRSALNFIQRFDERENVSFVQDFVAVKRETAAGRSLLNVLDTDPVDFRGILENAGAVMGQRSLEWHMDALYPGLMFKIGPTADANSVAEFVLDEGAQDVRQFGYEDVSTGRVLAKQYLLPFLLGLKFNLVALVPLLFAGICLLLKKSLFLAKLAVYVSSFLGLGGVLGSLGSFGVGGGLAGFNVGAGLGGFGLQRPLGHFPGKTTVFGQSDELHHQYHVQEPPPYKRNDRKLQFEAPRHVASNNKPRAVDNFYEFDKVRHTNALEKRSNFQDSTSSAGMNGWQVVDVRSL